jgi:sporulation protein YabP
MKVETKKEIRIEDRKSNLTLENRKKLVLTGVVEVISFNEEKILLNTTQGMLTIKGTGLKMNKLDVQNGDVVIAGTVDSFVYTGSEVKQDKESILAKLFK